MATVGKLCQAEETENCPNEARALCYHCSRDLCLDHLTRHAQIIDELTRTRLDDYLSLLNKASLHLQSLTISENILNEPFAKVEQWRENAYQQIDQIVEKKLAEIHIKIDEYSQIFHRLRTEQLERIHRYQQKINDLLRKSQVAHKDLSSLQKSIEQIENNLEIFNKHSIEVISTRPLISSLDIRMRCNEWKSPSPSSSSSSSLSSIIRQFEFRLKFVRQSGFVTSHDVLVEVNLTIGDLIDQFLLQQDPMNLVHRQRHFYLATEICQHRLRQRLNNNLPLKEIFNRIESLVLYETSFELTPTNLERSCLIFCRFEDGLPWEIRFHLPLLLHVPRFQCRGKDIIDLLNKTLSLYFPLIHLNSHFQYEVRLVSDEQQIDSKILLNELADQIIDEHLLIADNATLLVNLIDDANNQMLLNEQKIQRARLDGITKINDRRRKNRK